MVGGLIAANSSTILTHLNWGASYLVHDFYRQFIKSDASERHYVTAARLVTLLLFVCSSATVYLLDTAKEAFDVILQIGAGTGLLYLVRWFRWRVNAWSEIVAMVSSFGFSLILLILARNGVVFTTHAALLMTVAVTTVCWLFAAYLAPETDPDVLVAFYTAKCGRSAPMGPGPRPRGALPADEHAAENIPMALLGCFAGSLHARNLVRRCSRSANFLYDAPAWPGC